MYMGLLYACTCEWNIAPLYVLYLSLAFFFAFTHKGVDDHYCRRRRGVASWGACITSYSWVQFFNDRPIRSWNQNVSVRENSIARHDYSFWSEKLSECEWGGEIWIRITVPRRRPYRRRTDGKSWIFLAEWKLFQELQHASISCCLMC